MNRDSNTATPVSLSSPYPNYKWASNTFDILSCFDFPSENKVQLSFATSNQKSKVSFNQILHCRSRDRKTSFRIEQILQFYMLGSNAFIWGKCTTDEVKVHLTHNNLIKCPITKEGSLRFYGSYSVTRQVNNPSFKVGLLWSESLLNNFADIRLRFNKGEFTSQQYMYFKGAYTWNAAWTLGSIIVVDLKRILLQKNDVKLGWEINDSNWLSLQLESEGFRNYKINKKRIGSYFDILRSNQIHRFKGDKWKGGLTVEYNLQNKQLKKVDALVDFNSAGGLSNLKAKISNNLEVAVGAAFDLTSYKMKAEFGVLFNKLALLNFTPASYGVNLNFGEQ